MLALLEAGADFSATDERGLTPLQLAAVEGQEHCVATLLAAGAPLPASFSAGDGTDDAASDEVACEEACAAAALIQQIAGDLGLLPAAHAPAWGGAAPTSAAAPAAPSGCGGASAALDDCLCNDVCCPITHEVMEQPVIAADGTTYEKSAIQCVVCVACMARCVGCRACLLC